MTDLLDLAARVEAAEGPDKELDALIRCALFAPEGAYIEKSRLNGVWCIWTGEGPTGRRRLFDRFPSQAIRLGEFTASLDAAMTLVPEGCVFSWDGLNQQAGILRPPRIDLHGYDWLADAVAATPALALCAAALRSRASGTPTPVGAETTGSVGEADGGPTAEGGDAQRLEQAMAKLGHSVTVIRELPKGDG